MNEIQEFAFVTEFEDVLYTGYCAHAADDRPEPVTIFQTMPRQMPNLPAISMTGVPVAYAARTS